MLLGTKSLDITLVDENGHSAPYHAGGGKYSEVFRLLLNCPAMDVNTGRVLECIGSLSTNPPHDCLVFLLSGYEGLVLAPHQQHQSGLGVSSAARGGQDRR